MNRNIQRSHSTPHVPRPPSGGDTHTTRSGAAATSASSQVLADLDRQHPDKPCLVLLHVGPLGDDGTRFLKKCQKYAARLAFDFSAIAIQCDDGNTREWLRKNVPQDALVLLTTSESSAPSAPAVDMRAFVEELRGRELTPPLGAAPLPAGGAQAREGLWSVSRRMVSHTPSQTQPHAFSSLTPWDARPTIQNHGQSLYTEQKNWFDACHQALQEQIQRDIARTMLETASDIASQFPQFHGLVQSMLHSPIWNPSFPGIPLPLASRSTSPALTPLDALSAWLRLPPPAGLEADTWSAIQQSPQAGDLVQLVRSMQELDPKASGRVAQLWRQLAAAMAKDAGFAATVLNLAEDATAACIDRESLVLFRLETALMAHELRQTCGAGLPLASVHALARQVYRREAVENIAANKVSELQKENERRKQFGQDPLFIDAVSTSSAYLCDLQDILELGGERIDPKFADTFFTNLKTGDTTAAYEQVIASEAEGFPEFLLSYPLWREALRSHPQWADEVQTMEERLAELDAGLEAQVQHDLKRKQDAQETQLTESEFQQAVTRELTNRSKAHSQQAWRELTQRVLHKEQLG